MKKTLTTYEVAHELMQDQYANWSRAGAFAIAEHLEQFEEEYGEQIELDVVSIRCDFSEFKDFVAWGEHHFGSLEAMNKELGLFENPSDLDDLLSHMIVNEGQLIEFDGGIIVSSF